MIDPTTNMFAVTWRIIIAALAVFARLALDRLSFRGRIRGMRRRRR